MYGLISDCQYLKIIPSNSIYLFQTLCSNEGNACIETTSIDTDRCLTPCEGIFVDVKRDDPEKINNTEYDIFLQKYKNYKKFFETSEGKVVEHLLTSLLCMI